MNGYKKVTPNTIKIYSKYNSSTPEHDNRPEGQINRDSTCGIIILLLLLSLYIKRGKASVGYVRNAGRGQ